MPGDWPSGLNNADLSAGARQLLDDMHEAAWGAPREQLHDDLIQCASRVFQHLDIVCATTAFAETLSRVSTDGLRSRCRFSAMVQIAEPSIELVSAAEMCAQCRYAESIELAWKATDAVLIAVGCAIGGFSFTEPWSHGRQESAAKYLAQLEAALIDRNATCG